MQRDTDCPVASEFGRRIRVVAQASALKNSFNMPRHGSEVVEVVEEPRPLSTAPAAVPYNRASSTWPPIK